MLTKRIQQECKLTEAESRTVEEQAQALKRLTSHLDSVGTIETYIYFFHFRTRSASKQMAQMIIDERAES